MKKGDRRPEEGRPEEGSGTGLGGGDGRKRMECLCWKSITAVVSVAGVSVSLTSFSKSAGKHNKGAAIKLLYQITTLYHINTL